MDPRRRSDEELGRATLPAPEAHQVYAHPVEALFLVGLKGRLTPTLQAQLKDAGLDLSRPLAQGYPRAAWNHFLALAAAGLWPGEPPERAYQALGRALLAGSARTLMGAAMMRLLRMAGPRRTLEQLAQSLREGCNYNLSRLTELGPHEVLLWLNEPTLHPAYVAGIIDATLERVGVAQREVQVHARDAEGCTYRVRWGA